MNTAAPSRAIADAEVLELLRTARHRPARCGDAATVLAPALCAWFRNGLQCLAGRREYAAGRYFAVDVQRLSDVLYGWRRFVEALERRESVACLYVVTDPCAVPGVDPGEPGEEDTGAMVQRLAQVMSPLSDVSAASLADGGQLNFVLHLQCPVTGARTAFFDFDAVAFVPQASDRLDPLYDPLMSAPVPMVNISSDVYGYAMFTRDHCRQRFDCEVTSLTRRERRFLFRYCAESWQRIAEATISAFAADVDQQLCPTELIEDRSLWLANHRDPAFAELEKRPYLHEMPVQYAPRLELVWERFFEQGIGPDYRQVAAAGVARPAGTEPAVDNRASRCPMSARMRLPQ